MSKPFSYAAVRFMEKGIPYASLDEIHENISIMAKLADKQNDKDFLHQAFATYEPGKKNLFSRLRLIEALTDLDEDPVLALSSMFESRLDQLEVDRKMSPLIPETINPFFGTASLDRMHVYLLRTVNWMIDPSGISSVDSMNRLQASKLVLAAFSKNVQTFWNENLADIKKIESLLARLNKGENPFCEMLQTNFAELEEKTQECVSILDTEYKKIVKDFQQSQKEDSRELVASNIFLFISKEKACEKAQKGIRVHGYDDFVGRAKEVIDHLDPLNLRPLQKASLACRIASGKGKEIDYAWTQYLDPLNLYSFPKLSAENNYKMNLFQTATRAVRSDIDPVSLIQETRQEMLSVPLFKCLDLVNYELQNKIFFTVANGLLIGKHYAGEEDQGVMAYDEIFKYQPKKIVQASVEVPPAKETAAVTESAPSAPVVKPDSKPESAPVVPPAAPVKNRIFEVSDKRAHMRPH